MHADTCMEKSKKHNARRQSGSPRQQYIEAISAFVDSIDSHIILRMIRQSKSSKYFETISNNSEALSYKKLTQIYFENTNKANVMISRGL